MLYCLGKFIEVYILEGDLRQPLPLKHPGIYIYIYIHVPMNKVMYL